MTEPRAVQDAALRESDIEVSFVLIAYNEADKIEQTLRHVLAQRFVGAGEVILVDDGSTDGTPDVAERMSDAHPQIRVVRFQRNCGRGAARHAGVLEARGRWIAFVDADVLLEPDWFETCLEAMEGHDAVAGIAVPDGDVAWVHAAFGLAPKIVPHTTTVTGNNALFRREIFDVVQFDETLRNGEDIKLGVDMAEHGLISYTVPGLTVRHAETKSFRQSLAWLFESGCGATRQMCRDRTVRLPDVVATGFHATAAAGALTLAACRDSRLLAAAAAIPPVAALAHLSTKFHLGRTPARSVAAWAGHTPLMAAYLVGRLVGFVGVARAGRV